MLKEGGDIGFHCKMCLSGCLALGLNSTDLPYIRQACYHWISKP